MIPANRFWMYDRLHENRGVIKAEFFAGVDYFCMKSATRLAEQNIRCPCSLCKRCKILDVEIVKLHLYKNGFERHYWIWTDHGEVDGNGVNEFSRSHCSGGSTSHTRVEEDEETGGFEFNHNDRLSEMVNDAFDGAMLDEEPNTEANNFYSLLQEANTPVWEGSAHTKLSTAVRMLSMKSDANQSERSFDQWVSFIQELTPPNSEIPSNFYQAKKIFSKLGLKSLKIDCCTAGCMLYYKDEANLTECRFCGAARFKPIRVGPGRYKKIPYKRMHYLPLIPRLKRLFASMSSAPHMRWHYDNKRNDGNMTHPSHAEAWQHFDRVYPDFAADPRNVRLGLCSDGFSPNNQFSKPYSCWPVIVTPYNLPPDMCMKDPYLFLSCVIPGPTNPKAKIDVFLQPLIDELNMLWSPGVLAYDVSMKQNFMLRACLMWTINDFPAYGMLSGWMTAGRLACPVCMEDTNAFRLQNGGKQSWFDCHRVFLDPDHTYRNNKYGFRKNKIENAQAPQRLTSMDIWRRVRRFPKITDSGNVRLPGYGEQHNWTKKSIFWDLPYWKDNLVRHCLDVMHIEKNVFDNIMHTVMNTDQTKDNEKARMDLKDVCRRRELNLQEISGGRVIKPKATYTLNKQQVQRVLHWLQTLRLPDGYASNLARCVNIAQGKLVGMKSHDCHVFMQCLLPIAFRELPKNVSKPLIELSHFFRTLCSSTVNVEDLLLLEHNIPIIICQLERLFPPSFFDVMEHLPVHLPYEARMCGPVQYRWMYPFERCMGVFKRTVKNRARIEGSICEAFLTKETSFFCSYYFAATVDCRRTTVGRNDDGGGVPSLSTLSVFNQTGRPAGKGKDYWLSGQEKEAAHLVVLLNCEEVLPYYEMFRREFGDEYSNQMFPSWFANYVQNNSTNDSDLMSLTWGPMNKAISWPIYFVNGYKFHTHKWSTNQNTDNSGVCVKGEYSNTDGPSVDFYGVLQKILVLEYKHNGPSNHVVLFYCDWYDPSPNGTRTHPDYYVTEINHRRRYNGYDPFIVAERAKQVYYASYPGPTQSSWKVVIKSKPSGRIEMDGLESTEASTNDQPYQVSDPIPATRVVSTTDTSTLLATNDEPEIFQLSNLYQQSTGDVGNDDDEEEEEEEEEVEEEEQEEEEFNDELNSDETDDDVYLSTSD